MSSVLPPTDTPFGERVARRLREEAVIWLTTVGSDGTPQPNPVWYLWDGGESVLIYSLNDAARERNIERDARVSLNFDGNGAGGDIIVLTGTARISRDEPQADQNAAFSRKYQARIAGSFGTPANFASKYSVPIRVTIQKVRGF